MKKVRSLILYSLVGAGMIYAFITVAATPLAACTPTQCDSIRQSADFLCGSIYGWQCDVGVVDSCDASGYVLFCQDSSGGTCGAFFNQCS